jgi:hypothetical protein
VTHQQDAYPLTELCLSPHREHGRCEPRDVSIDEPARIDDRTLPLCDVSTKELAITQDATLVLFAFTEVLLFRQMGELDL